eukprot:GSMAST32.ASY1.ANO1.2509.1 assembled CDS
MAKTRGRSTSTSPTRRTRSTRGASTAKSKMKESPRALRAAKRGRSTSASPTRRTRSTRGNSKSTSEKKESPARSKSNSVSPRQSRRSRPAKRERKSSIDAAEDKHSPRELRASKRTRNISNSPSHDPNAHSEVVNKANHKDAFGREKSSLSKPPNSSMSRSRSPPRRRRRYRSSENLSDSSASPSNKKVFKSEESASTVDAVAAPQKTEEDLFGPDGIKADVSNSEGTVSCSVAETNRIRALLGMKPLSTGGSAHENAEKKLWSEQKQRLDEKVKEKRAKDLETKLAKLKRQKAYYAKLEGKGLGEQSDEDESALAWVEKSRKSKVAKEVQEKVEKIKALKLSHRFDQEDESFGNVYSAADLKGMKIQHGVDQFSEGTTVLTLKDSSVLEEGNDAASGQLILENVELRDDERTEFLKKQRERAALPVYSAVDDEMDIDEALSLRAASEGERQAARKKKLLQHYNEQKQSGPKMTLDGSETITSEEIIRRAEEKRIANCKLRPGEVLESLSVEKPKISDYYTKSEVEAQAVQEVTFKKKRKKKKKRRKKALDKKDATMSFADQLETGINGSQNNKNNKKNVDRGSRSKSKKRQQNEKDSRNEQERRARSYRSAQRKAGEIDQRVYKEEAAAAADAAAFDSGDDDAFLAASIARARRLAKVQKKANVGEGIRDHAASVAQRVARLKEKSVKKVKVEGTVLFSSTEEFSQRLKMSVEERNAEKRLLSEASEKQNVDNISNELVESNNDNSVSNDMDIDSNDNNAGQNGPNSSIEKSTLSPTKEEDSTATNAFQEAEPLVKTGLAATLAMLSRRGDLRNSGEIMTGRANDKKKYYSDKDDKIKLEYRDSLGRLLSQKEAYRHLSYKFHGKKPGRKKQLKLMRKLEEERQLKHMGISDTPHNVVSRMKEKQMETGQSFLVVSKGKK